MWLGVNKTFHKAGSGLNLTCWGLSLAEPYSRLDHVLHEDRTCVSTGHRCVPCLRTSDDAAPLSPEGDVGKDKWWGRAGVLVTAEKRFSARSAMIHPETPPSRSASPHDVIWLSLLVLRLLLGGAARDATPAGGEPLGFRLPQAPLQVKPRPFPIVYASWLLRW